MPLEPCSRNIGGQKVAIAPVTFMQPFAAGQAHKAASRHGIGNTNQILAGEVVVPLGAEGFLRVDGQNLGLLAAATQKILAPAFVGQSNFPPGRAQSNRCKSVAQPSVPADAKFFFLKS